MSAIFFMRAVSDFFNRITRSLRFDFNNPPHRSSLNTGKIHGRSSKKPNRQDIVNRRTNLPR